MNTFPRTCILTTALAVAAFAILPRAQAVQLAVDDFSSYPPGTNLSGQAGGSGFSDGYTVGASGQGFLNEVRNAAPLSYPNYTANGGNYANIASGFGGPSFNFAQRTLDVAGAFAAYNDGTRIGANNTTLWGSFLYNNTAGGQVLLQGAGNNFLNLPTTGQNSLFVFRINFGPANADTISIFSNPDLTTFNAGSVPSSTLSGDFSFQTVGFVAPNDQNEVRVDNVRFGSTVADVVPVVPEPSTWAWLMAGVAALFVGRKVRAARA